MNLPSSSLSIITAVHNGLTMNQLYWKALTENTNTPFELIIVDNHSTDGSEVFFSHLAQSTVGSEHQVIYLRNEKNQSYPQSQIQGMQAARFAIHCFLNNDIWMPPQWELPLIEALRLNSLLVVSPSGQEAQPNQKASDKLKNRWKRAVLLSKLWAFVLQKSEVDRLWKSLYFMYGDLNCFINPTNESAQSWFHAIKGDAVVLHRDLLKKVPQIWDPRIEAADWHLYLLLASLHEKDGSIPLPRVILSSYVHHFGRYSARQSFEPLENTAPFLSIESVWGKTTMERLWWGSKLPAK